LPEGWFKSHELLLLFFGERGDLQQVCGYDRLQIRQLRYFVLPVQKPGGLGKALQHRESFEKLSRFRIMTFLKVFKKYQ
jgi:hypothetical protein